MNRVRHSFFLSSADSYLSIGLQIGSTLIISRILTPEEIGVFAIAAVFSSLAASLRDFGLGEYLIQAQDLTDDRIRAAFGLNLGVSWLMAAALFFGAPVAADFYQQPGVGRVLQVLAISFLLVPFGAIVQCYFRRELNYKPLFIINAAANTSSFCVSVALAVLGYSYMSLAWASVVGILLSVIGALYFRPSHFPRWPGVRGIAEVFHFGKYTTSMFVLAQLGHGAPELILGRTSGVAAVGIFSRANGTVELFRRVLLRPVLQVCLPYFAKANREQGALGSAYVVSVAMLTGAGWPFLAFMSLAAFAVIRLIYGAQWLEAVPFTRILCLACAVELLFLLTREALLALGEAKRATVLQIEVIALQLAGLALALPFGMLGASWGLVLAALLGLIVSHRHLHSALGVKALEVFRACLPSSALTLWTVAPLAIADHFVPIGGHNYVSWAILGVVSACVLWLSGVVLFRHPLGRELEILVRGLVPRYRGAR